jgi:hypothetical protein
MSDDALFLEVDYAQKCKKGNLVAGDVFLSTRTGDDSVVTVLADGLGSGIKANVLAMLTAKMASGFVLNDMDIKKSAEVIINTLPICSERKIGYSTFTVVRIERGRSVKVIEYDNPAFILLRNGTIVPVKPEEIAFAGISNRENIVRYYSFDLEYGDRLLFFSDGVTQSGMGSRNTPLGWGIESAGMYVRDIVKSDPEISARTLSRMIVSRANAFDGYAPHDDITCEAIFCRRPRKLLVATGPSLLPEKDAEMARIIADFGGSKAICGGTTTKIVSRELDIPVKVDITNITGNLPPESSMQGIDLVTEGILTLCRTSELLDRETYSGEMPPNPASKLADMMLNNDIIHFLVGTKINEAHQDPSMPQEIEIRRSIVKKIMRTLEEKHFKKTSLHFI